MRRQAVVSISILAVATTAALLALHSQWNLSTYKSIISTAGRRSLVDLSEVSFVKEASSEDSSVDVERTRGRDNQKRDCSRRRVFIVDLGVQFHTGLLTGTKVHDKWHQHATRLNGGFGPLREFTHLAGSRRSALGAPGTGSPTSSSNSSTGHISELQSSAKDRSGEVGRGWPDLSSTWYNTWSNALDVVFHNRMLTYPCRVDTSDAADLFYVPYYGSLDISAHIGQDNHQRGQLGKELSQKLLAHPVYKKRQGRDHFVVIGRPYWDFIANLSDPGAGWGSGVMREEPFTHAQIVTVERPPWVKNTIGVPYPMAFHPPGKREMQHWVDFASNQERPWLFVFAGARRRVREQHRIERAVQMRNAVFWQCEQSSQCQLIDCENPLGRCEHDWRIFTQLYLSSSFCVHPRGDSCTRRAVLDSMLAGCIPVMLEECSLQWQLDWLLGPADQFSIYIDGDKLRQEGQEASPGVMLEEVLSAAPAEKVEKMRRKVLEMIPKFTYGGTVNGNAGVEAPDFEDAVDSVIDQVWHNMKEASPGV